MALSHLVKYGGNVFNIQTLKRATTPHARCMLATRFTRNAEWFTQNGLYTL